MKNTRIIIGLVIITIIIVLGVVFDVKSNTTNDVVGEASVEKSHEDALVATYEVYPKDVADKITKGEDIVLLDVRTPEEHGEIHLENSLLLPVDEISQATLNIIGLGEDAKDKEIILYCRSGSRSKRAYDTMTALGYTNLKSVAGGMVHWQEDNYPYTESGVYAGVDYSSTEVTVTDGARISFDKTKHEFGQIPRNGGTVSADFVVSNTGTKDLVIGDITTSCGCTSAELDTKTIIPGSSTTLTVVFDPDFHKEPQGAFTRTVFIPTNDASMPEAELTVGVEILEQ